MGALGATLVLASADLSHAEPVLGEKILGVTPGIGGSCYWLQISDSFSHPDPWSMETIHSSRLANQSSVLHTVSDPSVRELA